MLLVAVKRMTTNKLPSKHFVISETPILLTGGGNVWGERFEGKYPSDAPEYANVSLVVTQRDVTQARPQITKKHPQIAQITQITLIQ